MGASRFDIRQGESLSLRIWTVRKHVAVPIGNLAFAHEPEQIGVIAAD